MWSHPGPGTWGEGGWAGRSLECAIIRERISRSPDAPEAVHIKRRQLLYSQHQLLSAHWHKTWRLRCWGCILSWLCIRTPAGL